MGLAVLAVVAAGIYRFNFTQDDLYYRTPSGEVVTLDEWEARQAAGDDVMRRLFSIADGGPLALRLPERDQAVPLTRFEPEGEFTRAVGEYSLGPERGRVVMDVTKMRALSLERGGRHYLAVPFSVSNQGSGVFHYLALLEHDADRRRVRHVDSVLLGDRVVIESLEPTPDGRRLVVSVVSRFPGDGDAGMPDTREIAIETGPVRFAAPSS